MYNPNMGKMSNLEKSISKNSIVNHASKKLTTTLFIIYLIALCWILVLKLGVQFSYMEQRRVNLNPFVKSGGNINISEIILNVLIFVPLGIYAAIIFERWSFGKKVLFVFSMSLIVEAVQFILAVGALDITDIITNTIGGIIGLLIFKAIEKGFNNSVKAQKFVNLVAAIGTASMILLLLLLKLDMLPIKYR